MLEDKEKLPDNIDALKAIILQLEECKEDSQKRIENYKGQIAQLLETIKLMRHKRFGASTEQSTQIQLGLFDEAELEVLNPEPEVEAEEETITVGPYQKSRGKRKPLPEHLPRIEIEHDLSEEEKVCPHDGTALKRIGEEVSEQLDIIPATIQVIRHIRPKYSCPCCENGVKVAPMPPQPIPKSMASAALLAWLIISKYQDALPLYRLEQMLKRIEVNIPRTTMARWVIQCGQLILPLLNLMRERMLEYDVLCMDETTVQVLDEEGKSAQSKSYMWVQRGGPPEQPIILFDYDASRSRQVPLRLLEEYQGYLQTDGYAGYNEVVKANSLTRLGCWTHARRKFDDVIKAQGKNAKPGRAHQAIAWIKKLYRIEKECKAMTPSERQLQRQEQASPILEKMRDWLDKSLPQVPPTSLLGKALHYLNAQWPTLIVYLEDGRLNIDNNLTENAIRPFAVGRKNWMFSQSVKGVEASAALYSLIETAKANGIEPWRYLNHVFKELPACTTLEQLEALLPYHLDKEQFTPSSDR